jgi:hypothetical protein
MPATVYQYCVSIVDADGEEGQKVCDAGSRILFAPGFPADLRAALFVISQESDSQNGAGDRWTLRFDG